MKVFERFLKERKEFFDYKYDVKVLNICFVEINFDIEEESKKKEIVFFELDFGELGD